MLDRYLRSRMSDAKKLVQDLHKYYDYVSILGTAVHTKRIVVSSRLHSIDDVDNECGFVIKVYKDGRYSEYSCDDIKDLKAATVKKALRLEEVYSKEFSVKMLEESEHKEDLLR